jgi:drug/metabolite transporter (DMT)-like permease
VSAAARSLPARSAELSNRRRYLDLVAIGATAAIWGTSWYAITHQLGVVDPVVSVVYRFGLASMLLFLWCVLRSEPIQLTLLQHRAAAGVGFFTFTIDYTCVYWAETRVVSAVVAVVFATLAFVSLVLFRWIFGQRESRSAWMAAALGALGVALLSWGEIRGTRLDGPALAGLGLAFIAVIAAAFGNVFARYGEAAGARLATSTAWSMGYGAAFLTLFALLTGRPWAFEPEASYVMSLLYLSVASSVVAFLLYFGVARRRGYGTASYILALTPLLAMVMSARFEGKRWSAAGLGGVALVLSGQWMLLRARRIAR